MLTSPTSLEAQVFTFAIVITSRLLTRFAIRNSNFAPTVHQATSQRPAALPHRELANVAYRVTVGSIFDANQQNKTGLVNLFNYRELMIWVPWA